MTRIISTIFLLAILQLLSATSAMDNNSISKAQFTTEVLNNSPVNNITSLDASVGQVSFFTEIRKCKGCTIQHKWFHNGNLQIEMEIHPTHNKYNWWSDVRLNGLTGVWRVDVVVNGVTQTSQTLVYGEDFAQRSAPAPIQKQLEESLSSECEAKLKHFHTMAKENPNDPYYDFMVRKWGARCYQ